MKDFPIDDRNEIGKKKQKVPRAMMSKFVEQQIREMVRKEISEADGTLDRGERALPSKIKIYMKRFTDELNKANLNKIKKVAVLYKIIQGLGLKPQEMVMYVQKIKKGMKSDDSVEEGKLQEGEGLGWSLDWESEIAQLINSKELKTLLKDKNSNIKRIAQRLKKNIIQVHIGFDGLKDELRKVYGEGKLSESWSYRDYTYDQIHDIKGRISYVQKALKQKDIKDWEKKEFTDLLKDLKKTLRVKSDHLKWIDKTEKQMGEGKLTENSTWKDMRKGDYLKDVYKMGQLDVVTDTEKYKGNYQAWINPKGSNKAIVGIAYNANQFVDSGKKKGGKIIWVVKK